MKQFDLSVYGRYAAEAVFYNEENFTEVTEEEILGQSRWSTQYSQILKYKDGTFWQAMWSRGSTEYQDEGVEDLELVQVEPKEVTTTIYVNKE